MVVEIWIENCKMPFQMIPKYCKILQQFMQCRFSEVELAAKSDLHDAKCMKPEMESKGNGKMNLK